MTTKPDIILTTNSISVYFGTVVKTVDRTSPAFSKLIEMLRVDNPATIEDILTFLDPARRLSKHASGLFDVCNGGVYINGERTPDLFSKRALELADLGLDVKPLLALWANIKLNPDQEMIKDLYVFLDRNEHPITPDGCFVGYRGVTADFKDRWTNSMENKPGSICRLNRADCVADRNVACGPGLHVASLTYARDVCGGAHIIVCKVNPKNCVSVPVDHSQQKLRCCEFEVLEVLENVKAPIVKPVYEAGVDKQNEAQVNRGANVATCVIRTEDAAKSVGGTLRRATDDNYRRQKRDAKGHFIKQPKY